MIVEGRETLDHYCSKRQSLLGGEPITGPPWAGWINRLDHNNDLPTVYSVERPVYRVDEHVHRAQITVERIKGDVREVLLITKCLKYQWR